METALSCMYLKPDSQTTNGELDKQTMTEVWKGPWSEIRKLYDEEHEVFGATIIPGRVRPIQFSNSDLWKHEFEPPGTNDGWIIQDVNATEIVAGELGELTITYSAGETSEGGGGGGGGTTDNFPQEVPTTWSLSWGSEQRSVLAYCDESTGQRATQVVQCKNNPHPTLEELQANGYPSATEEDAKYDFWAGTTDIYRSIDRLVNNTNQGGRKIYDYYIRDISPIFHYPIITRHQRIKECPDALPTDPISMSAIYIPANKFELIDHKLEQMPEGCPFGAGVGWQWLCVEDNWEGTYENGQRHYNRTTVWWGAKQVDDNFYGDNAWEPYSPMTAD